LCWLFVIVAVVVMVVSCNYCYEYKWSLRLTTDCEVWGSLWVSLNILALPRLLVLVVVVAVYPVNKGVF
jgi:hypothetical protein